MEKQTYCIKKNYNFFLKVINQLQEPHKLTDHFYCDKNKSLIQLISSKKYSLINHNAPINPIIKEDEENDYDIFSYADFYLINPIAGTEQLESPLYLLSGAIEDGFYVLEGKMSLFNLDIIQENSHHTFSRSFVCKKSEQDKPSFMVNFHGEDVFIWIIE